MSDPQSAEAVRAGDARACGPAPIAAEEAAFREELATQAQEIADKVRRGEVSHGLSPGYRLEFTRREDGDWLTDYFAGIDYGRHGTREAEAWFPKQVRGNAPEPPPDGFLVPPGLAEALRESIMDAFDLPRDLFTRPVTPPTRRQRLKRKIEMWRNLAARRAYRIVAGYWPDNGEDDW